MSRGSRGWVAGGSRVGRRGGTDRQTDRQTTDDDRRQTPRRRGRSPPPDAPRDEISRGDLPPLRYIYIYIYIYRRSIILDALSIPSGVRTCNVEEPTVEQDCSRYLVEYRERKRGPVEWTVPCFCMGRREARTRLPLLLLLLLLRLRLLLLLLRQLLRLLLLLPLLLLLLLPLLRQPLPLHCSPSAVSWLSYISRLSAGYRGCQPGA